MPDRKAKAGGSRGLSKETIVQAAVALMEECGESRFSLRKLGEQVGCDPMAVLYHFKSKEGLQRAMADWLTAQLQPVRQGQPWRDRLRELATQYRQLALANPGTFALMQRFLNTGISDYQHIEMVYGALREAGLANDMLPDACVGWYATVYGLSMAEIGGLIHRPSPEEIEELERQVPPEFPLMRELLPMFGALKPAHVFYSAHDALLDGFEAHAVNRLRSDTPRTNRSTKPAL